MHQKRKFIEWRRRCDKSNKQAPDSRVRYLKCWQNSKLLEFTIFKIQGSNLPLLRSDTEMAKLFASTTSKIGIFVNFGHFATFEILPETSALACFVHWQTVANRCKLSSAKSAALSKASMLILFGKQLFSFVYICIWIGYVFVFVFVSVFVCKIFCRYADRLKRLAQQCNCQLVHSQIVCW